MCVCMCKGAYLVDVVGLGGFSDVHINGLHINMAYLWIYRHCIHCTSPHMYFLYTHVLTNQMYIIFHKSTFETHGSRPYNFEMTMRICSQMFSKDIDKKLIVPPTVNNTQKGNVFIFFWCSIYRIRLLNSSLKFIILPGYNSIVPYELVELWNFIWLSVSFKLILQNFSINYLTFFAELLPNRRISIGFAISGHPYYHKWKYAVWHKGGRIKYVYVFMGINCEYGTHKDTEIRLK